MVQIAVYDAVVAIEGGYQPFAFAIPAPAGSDVRAAVATAGYATARASSAITGAVAAATIGRGARCRIHELHQRYP